MGSAVGRTAQCIHPWLKEAATGTACLHQKGLRATVSLQIPASPPNFLQLHVSTPQDDPPTTTSGILTKLAGACLVEEQAHGDVPACGPAHAGMTGLLATQRIPSEVSIWFPDNRHCQIPLDDRRASLNLQRAWHMGSIVQLSLATQAKTGQEASPAMIPPDNWPLSGRPKRLKLLLYVKVRLIWNRRKSWSFRWLLGTVVDQPHTVRELQTRSSPLDKGH